MALGPKTKLLFALSVATAVAGCGGSEEDSDIGLGNNPGGNPPISNPGDPNVPPPVTVPGNPDAPPVEMTDALGGHYVTAFDMNAVRRVRETAQFAYQNISRRMSISNHPTLNGQQPTQTWNALQDIGVDFAHSVGLTGNGQIISIFDSMLLTTHDEFAGKDIYFSGVRTPTGNEAHGTAVSSIALGSADHGKMIGVAPGADLHFGVMDFNAGISTNMLAGYMQDAIRLGSVASSNSWTLQSNVTNVDLSSIFGFDNNNAYRRALTQYGDTGVVLFALSNNYHDTSATIMAGLPHHFKDLEHHWLAVTSGIPVSENGSITSATRVGSSCLEAARWCIAANGHVNAATDKNNSDYEFIIGTSLATPQVAGSIALLAEAFPTLKPEELRARLLVTADNGFFSHDAVLDFGNNLTHGYNAEWGHGFVDLRAALLPIGTLSTTDASGANIDLEKAPIIASGMSGDAISRGLAKANVILMDDMKGSFDTSADILVGSSRSNREGVDLNHFKSVDLRAFRSSLGGDVTQAVTQRLTASTDPMSFSATPMAMPITADLGMIVHMPAGEEREYGLGITKSFDIGNASLDLGASIMRENGSVAGISSGSRMKAEHASIDAVFTNKLGQDAYLSFGGTIGMAKSNADGMFTDVGTVRYDSLNVSLSRTNAIVPGDRLTVFAERPTAISSGTAQVALAQRAASGDVKVSSAAIDLAPTARQFDLGFDYTRPFSESTDLALGVRHSINQDNIANNEGTSVVFGVQMRF